LTRRFQRKKRPVQTKTPLAGLPSGEKLGLIVVEPLVTVKKPEPFLRWLFQAAVEIHQENVAEGHRSGFPRLRQFPQASLSELFFLFWSFFLSL